MAETSTLRPGGEWEMALNRPQHFLGRCLSGSRLCENSEIQIACRNSVSVSLILEINCTDGLCREKAIENKFLLVLGLRPFSHSLDPKGDISAPMA